MPTYVYETVSERPEEPGKRYEIEQRMSDPPLRKHPRTGERIHRVVTADLGISGFATPDCGSSCHLAGDCGNCPACEV